MTTHSDDELLTQSDFERLFAAEPPAADPADDVRRGRRRRQRRKAALGAAGAVAVVVLGGAAVWALPGRDVGFGPSDGGSAVPSPVPSSPAVAPPTSSASTSPDVPAAPRDTAPRLRSDGRGGYLDKDGLRLGGSLYGRDLDETPFHATTQNSWRLAEQHLDPSGKHLEAYDHTNFTGGGGGGGGLQIGQKIGWTVAGDRGQGMVQLAVTRPGPKEKVRLGTGEDREGFCSDLDPGDGPCRKARVAGVDVYLATTPDGGFVMDRLQRDGEVASIVVSPLFGNNTDVALRTMRITPASAAALLDDPALDVVG